MLENKRQTASNICKRLINTRIAEIKNPAEIIKSSNIGPIITNDSDTSDTISILSLNSLEQGTFL